MRTRAVTYIYRDIGNLDLYFECPYGKKFPEFFTPKWASLDKMMSLVLLARQDSELIGNGPRVSRNAQMRLVVGGVSLLRS